MTSFFSFEQISYPFTVLAPLAGVTNIAFRRLVKHIGCDLVCSEMISANGLVHQSRKTVELLQTDSAEAPLSTQLFGSDPDMMAEAALQVEASGTAICDINMGCSVKKIVKSGSGVALMKDPKQAERIFRAMRKKICIPLTVKIRTGWTPDGEQALAIAKIAQDCGLQAIAIHPRTATQAFRGTTDWSFIRKIKQTISIPVIGNGDIETPSDAVTMVEQTGCDGIMVGRAALSNPWIFTQISAYIAKKEVFLPGLADYQHLLHLYVDYIIQLMGELHGCHLLRSRLGWLVKGLPHNIRFRKEIIQLSTAEQAHYTIDMYIHFLQGYNQSTTDT